MSDRHPAFGSALAEHMRGFLEEKRALGHRYRREEAELKSLDRFLSGDGHTEASLPRALVERWTSAHVGERPASQAKRVGLVRQLSGYLSARGIPAYAPPERHGPVRCDGYVPYIFSREEIARLLSMLDALEPEGHSPRRYLVMPLIFRVLYGCGARVSEVLHLRCRDVDIERGVLTARDPKFRKDRVLPVARSLHERLRNHATTLPVSEPDAYFFPSPTHRPYDVTSVYSVFREALFAAGIPHRGRGAGPRLHDLRHTFAVHRLEQWYREGADLNAKLPFLSAYLGHRGLHGTMRYLRLTPHVFPDITRRMEEFVGGPVPESAP